MRVTQAFYHREGPFMVSPTILCGALLRVPCKIRRGGALCTRSEKRKSLQATFTPMVVEAPRVAEHCLPGQFIIAKMDEKGERIPLTICDYDHEKQEPSPSYSSRSAHLQQRCLQLQSRRFLRRFCRTAGTVRLSLVTEDLEEVKKKKILFVAGGVGTAPVYPQVKWLHEHGIECDVIIGCQEQRILIILEEEMKASCW